VLRGGAESAPGKSLQVLVRERERLRIAERGMRLDRERQRLFDNVTVGKPRTILVEEPGGGAGISILAERA
jgi:hypothetical protein